MHYRCANAATMMSIDYGLDDVNQLRSFRKSAAKVGFFFDIRKSCPIFHAFFCKWFLREKGVFGVRMVNLCF